jgi:hypothetical protein
MTKGRPTYELTEDQVHELASGKFIKAHPESSKHIMIGVPNS